MYNQITTIEMLAARSGGMVRAREARDAGVSPATLSDMVRQGRLERLTRGLYHVLEGEPGTHPDFVAVALKVPSAVIALISALSFHDLTLQIPRVVDVALPKSARAPKLAYPPLRVFWISEPAFSAGQETIELDGVPVRMYSPAKTVADSFKFRNRLGSDVAVEALRMYLHKDDRDLTALWRYAEICRVQQVMRPYVEAMLQ